MKNRRKHPRLDTDQRAALHIQNHTLSACRILNFSTGGVYLKSADSGLNSLLSEGYFAEDTCQHAVLELTSKQLEAEVSIAYRHGEGIGLHFCKTEQGRKFFSYLNSLVQESIEAPSVRLDSAMTSKLMQQIETMLLDHLRPKFADFFSESRKALLSAMREPIDNEQESSLFFAMNSLEGEEQKIANEFFGLVKRSFSELLEGRVDQSASETESHDQLELMEKAEIDRWLIVNDAARQSEAVLANTLYTMETSLSYLLQKPVASDRNPLLPQSLLNAMSRVLSRFELNVSSFQLILAVFQHTLLSDLKLVYEKIQQIFSEQGGELAQAPQTNDSNKYPYKQSANPVPIKPLSHLSTLFGLKYRNQIGDPQTDRNRVSTQQVVESLDILPLRLGTPLLKQLEQLLKKQLTEEKSLDPVTRAAISTGEELVVALQEDPLLPEELKGLVERLQLPIIQEIVLDPALLENSQHPVRGLLKACEQLTPYLSNVKAEAKGKSGITQLIDTIDQGSLTKLGQVTEVLEARHSELSTEFHNNRQLVISRCEQDERRLLTEQQVVRYLNNLLRGKSIPSVLDKLFQFGWISLLVQTHVSQGETSPAWKAYLRVIEILLKLFQSSASPMEMTSSHIHDLISIIRKGFRDHPVHPLGSKQFVIELNQALSQGGSALLPFYEPQVEFDDAYLAGFCSREYLASCDSSQVKPDQPTLETINSLDIGEWMVVETEGPCLKMLNLAWKNADPGHYLWVDGSGYKALDVNEGQFAEGLKSQTYQIISEESQSLVDRTIDHILSNGYNEIKNESSIDDLTGLMNRRSFERHLRELLANHRDGSINHTLILLDLDQFQVVNDLCGFEGGDILLRKIAAILLSYQSDESVVARVADDEFAILIPDTNLDQGFQVAESQRLAIEEYRFTWNDRLIPVSASLGVVPINNPLEMNTDAMLQAAVSACRLAKQAGRNCTRIYTPSDSAYQNQKQMIQTIPAIQEALKNDRMLLFAQPIIPLKKEEGMRTHYEILLRIMGDDGELQSPETFIKTAEQYDLMRAVDRWVVKRFFSIIEDYAERLDETAVFSVNLSAKSIADGDFKTFLRKQIASSSIMPQQLGFEITETALALDISEIAAFLNEIRSFGCSCYLDDFGSGYASFSYLRDLPVDYVKIDGVFVREMMHKLEDSAMVISITELAHFMGKQVIAEFVADKATSEALQDMGVDYAQGYYFGRPRLFTEQLDEIATVKRYIQRA